MGFENYTIEELRAVAKELNVTYSPNSKVETLHAKVSDACEDYNTSIDTVLETLKARESINEGNSMENVDITVEATNMGEEPIIDEAYKAKVASISLKNAPDIPDERQHEEMIRVLVTVNQPNLATREGDFIMVGNAKRQYKKYVAYNKPWHIPKIMLEVMKEKTFLQFIEGDKTKGEVSKTTVAPLYSITELGEMTPEEREAIVQEQVLRGNK